MTAKQKLSRNIYFNYKKYLFFKDMNNHCALSRFYYHRFKILTGIYKENYL